MTTPKDLPTSKTWVEVDRKVRVQVSAKDFITFLTSTTHLTGIDKKGLVELTYNGEDIIVTCSTATCSDPIEAVVDLGLPPSSLSSQGDASV
jgi:hypothetical protein